MTNSKISWLIKILIAFLRAYFIVNSAESYYVRNDLFGAIGGACFGIGLCLFLRFSAQYGARGASRQSDDDDFEL